MLRGGDDTIFPMLYKSEKIAGSLLFLSGTIGVLGIIVSEALYPSYSTSNNFISDLGVGPSSAIFNSSLVLVGLLAISSSYFTQRAFNIKLFPILSAVASIGAIGVGIFTEEAGIVHTTFSLITFLFAGVSVLASYSLLEPPLSYFTITFGVIALVALALFGSGTYLGLGKGGMERLIAYPVLLWEIAFGSHLLAS